MQNALQWVSKDTRVTRLQVEEEGNKAKPKKRWGI